MRDDEGGWGKMREDEEEVGDVWVCNWIHSFRSGVFFFSEKKSGVNALAHCSLRSHPQGHIHRNILRDTSTEGEGLSAAKGTSRRVELKRRIDRQNK